MSAQRFGDDETVRDVLASAQVWFVVGLSANTARAAFHVSKLLMDKGRTVVPINLRGESAHGQRGFVSVSEAAAALGPPDVVDVFVNSRRAGAIADEAIAAGARCVWFQLGVIDAEAAGRVAAAGRTMVMDRCPAQEWPRLGPAVS